MMLVNRRSVESGGLTTVIFINIKADLLEESRFLFWKSCFSVPQQEFHKFCVYEVDKIIVNRPVGSLPHLKNLINISKL